MTRSDYLLKHCVTPGQDPDKVYKWYEIYHPYPWPFNKIIADCGYVLDTKNLLKSDGFKRQCDALRRLNL